MKQGREVLEGMIQAWLPKRQADYLYSQNKWRTENTTIVANFHGGLTNFRGGKENRERHHWQSNEKGWRLVLGFQ